MKRNPIYPDIDKTKHNNGNLHEYDPYMITPNGNIIDTKWFESLTRSNKSIITIKNTFQLGNVAVPHEYQTDGPDNFLKNVHLSYLDSFDYHVWFKFEKQQIKNGPTNVKMLPINDKLKSILLSMYHNQPLNDSSDNLFLDKFKSDIDNIIKNNSGYFVRLSSTSGKNEKSLNPLFTVNDIIKRLTSIKLFVEKEYLRNKDTFLIIMPWNYKIDLRYEFRIFVIEPTNLLSQIFDPPCHKLVASSKVEGKISAACPQLWYECFQYSELELEIIEHALSNIDFIDNFEHKTFIADVYIDIDEKMCHLIELNPFGAHCGAGSELFNWITDYNVLHGIGDTNKPELRYLSIINF